MIKNYILIFAITLIPISNFAQDGASFKVFLNAFKIEEKQDTLLALGNVPKITSPICGNDAYTIARECMNFNENGDYDSTEVHLPYRKLIKLISSKTNSKLLWHQVLSGPYSDYYAHRQNKIQIKNFEQFYKNTTRISVYYKKVDHKTVFYDCTFTNPKNNIRKIDRYEISKIKGNWNLKKITTEVKTYDFEGVY